MRARTAAIMLVLVTFLAVAYVWRTDRALSMAAQERALVNEQRRLEDSLNALRVKSVALSGVERIKRIATTRLGLVEPEAPPTIVPAIEPLGSPDTAAGVRPRNPDTDHGGTGKR